MVSIPRNLDQADGPGYQSLPVLSEGPFHIPSLSSAAMIMRPESVQVVGIRVIICAAFAFLEHGVASHERVSPSMMKMSQQSRIGSSAEPPSQPDAVVVSVCRAEPYLRIALEKVGMHISNAGSSRYSQED